MRELRLSATADSDFQACQERYFLSYILDLTKDVDKDSTRVGTTWHALHEIIEHKADTVCPVCQRHEQIDPDCYVCGGTGYVLKDEMDRVARYLTRQYAVVPANKTRDDWEVERVTLLYSLSGHRWLYAADAERWEVIGSEIKTIIPVINPDTGRKMPKTVFVIKVDRLVRDKNTGLIYVWERKSTSHSITSADYWQGLAQGDQVSGYIYGARYAQKRGWLKELGIQPEDPLIAGAFCDVWHKPDIAPKMLSQAETTALIQTGEYCGEKFVVECADDGNSIIRLTVNREPATITPGKKAIAIAETPALYGARLLADIAERPDHYFAQREVSRTDHELELFQRRLFNIGRQIRYVEKQNLWVCNLQSCESKFRCEFMDLCRSGVQVDSEAVPVGYKKRHPQAEEVTLE